MSKVLIGNFKGPQGEQGIPGIQGEQGDQGIRGSRWTEGTAITGTSTTPTVFSGTGISDALAEDMYLNTDTGNAYRCTTGGVATVAKWVYACNLKGIKGDTGAKGDPGTAGPKGEKGDTGEQGPKGDTPTVADNMTVAFTEAATRENISTGEKMSVLMGKIKKWFADLTAPAFAQMITTKEDLLATKVTGYVPDAKAVADTYTELNGKLANKIDSNRFIMSDTGIISGFVKNNEVWLTIFNRISTPDSCVCIVSRYADVVSVYTVSKSATMNIEYNNQGTITVKYNGSTSGVYGGAFKFFG